MNLPQGRALALLAAGLLAPALSLPASPKVSSLFGDGMVLQRECEIPVWGTAAKNETIRVSFGEAQLSTQADEQGRWLVRLPPQPASSQPAALTIEGEEKLVIRDVLVGEVWLCSGQSNIEWPLRLSDGGEQEAAAADLPSLRFFRVERTMAHEPASAVKGDWKPCSPATAPHFSGVCFFFAKEVHRALGVPVGIIDASWGGTPIESWLSPQMLEASGHAETIRSFWARTVAEYPEKKAAYDKELAAWQKKAAEAKAAGLPEPGGAPWRPAGPGLPEEPSTLWYGMISPLVPYAARGFVWYQGESNVGRDKSYGPLFAALIDGWRSAWLRTTTNGGEARPFLFVQLPNFDDKGAGPEAWPRLREQQALALSLPATAMAVTLDAGQADNLHPHNKRDVGHRLALLAQARVYGKAVASSGPRVDKITFDGNTVSVLFGPPQGSLRTYGGEAPALAVAGADRIFHPARCKIEGSTVLASSPAVPEPLAVRYAWLNAPEKETLLTDDTGIPALPFRSDSW